MVSSNAAINGLCELAWVQNVTLDLELVKYYKEDLTKNKNAFHKRAAIIFMQYSKDVTNVKAPVYPSLLLKSMDRNLK